MSNNCSMTTDLGPTNTLIGIVDTVVDLIRAADVPAIVTAVGLIDTSVSHTSTTIAGVIVEDISTGTPHDINVQTGAGNTFGAWVQFDAALSEDSWLNSLIVSFGHDAGLAADWVVEVGIGAGGSEVTMERFSMKAICTADRGAPIVQLTAAIPKFMAAGERVSVHASCNQANKTVWCSVQYEQGLET